MRSDSTLSPGTDHERFRLLQRDGASCGALYSLGCPEQALRAVLSRTPTRPSRPHFGHRLLYRGERERQLPPKLYPYPDKITCAGLGGGAEIKATYPDVSYTRIQPGRPLPFADGAFDIAYSNAVLEHVGNAEARHRFLGEALRVARNVFITVPNRWFPIEHHTGIPLLHFSPALFRRALKPTRFGRWADPDALEFLSAGLLERECAPWPGARIVHGGLPLSRFSSNIAIVWNRTI